jgi:hypothetical protein
LNFKRISILLTVLLAIVVIYATYKVAILDLFPWLNVLISSSLSFIVFVLSFLVKGKSKVIQSVMLSFFILQLFINFTILQNSDFFIKNWRWLFYLISIFVYLLSFSVCFKKEKKLLLISLVVGSSLFFILGIFSANPIWLTLQMLFYILFSVTVVVTKKISKSKFIESN